MARELRCAACGSDPITAAALELAGDVWLCVNEVDCIARAIIRTAKQMGFILFPWQEYVLFQYVRNGDWISAQAHKTNRK